MLGHTAAFYAAGTVSREHTELATFERLSSHLSRTLPPDDLARLMREGAHWPSDEAAQHAMVVVAPDQAPDVPTGLSSIRAAGL